MPHGQVDDGGGQTKSARRFAGVLLVSFAAIGGLLTSLFSQFVDFGAAQPEIAAASAEETQLAQMTRVEYVPPMPGDAPETQRDTVFAGERVLLANAVNGNGMRCSNCHFRAGITRGGRNGGFSLVGAAATRPEQLSSRVASCFRVNLNAEPPAVESPEMVAIDSYLAWISKGVPLYADVPWLKVQPLATAHAPDRGAGREVFAEVCAQCHGSEGQSTPIAPALWGDRSFTSASAMTRLEVLAPFIALNMPRQSPSLSPEQAVDAAAYVLTGSRPAPRFAAPSR